MKKRLLVAAIILSFLLLCREVYINSFSVFDPEGDVWKEMYRNRREHPLSKVDVNDSSAYMLVRHAGGRYYVETDTQRIKENVSAFRVFNRNDLYWTTADRMFELFKDGKRIDSVIYDNMFYTPRIRYGTLRFREVNQLQYLLLVGYEIEEQGENHIILFSGRYEGTYYFSFAHVGDLGCLKTVRLVNSAATPHQEVVE